LTFYYRTPIPKLKILRFIPNLNSSLIFWKNTKTNSTFSFIFWLISFFIHARIFFYTFHSKSRLFIGYFILTWKAKNLKQNHIIVEYKLLALYNEFFGIVIWLTDLWSGNFEYIYIKHFFLVINVLFLFRNGPSGMFISKQGVFF
jgi:hypothetical protein